MSTVDPDGRRVVFESRGAERLVKGAAENSSIIRKKQEAVTMADTPGGQPKVVPVTAEEVVSHEFSHAVDNDNGDTAKSSQDREHKAREVEDSYREEQDLPGRRNYVEGN